jgi:hypothetical protein
VLIEEGAGMWDQFREEVRRLWQGWRTVARKRTESEVRARFWDEVHDGEREAEEESRR